MRHARTTMFRGRQVPLTEVAKELGMSYLRVWQRTSLGRETGDDIERDPSIKKPGTRKKWIVEHDGVSMSVTEWAKQLGVNENTIRYRVKKHGTPYPAKTVNLGELAKEHGISYGALRGRLNRGEPLETALGPYRTKGYKALIEIDGVVRKRKEVMEEAGVSRQLLSARLAKGWPLADAASTPPRQGSWKDRLFEENRHTVADSEDGVVFKPDPDKEYTPKELMAIVYGMGKHGKAST